MPRAAGPKTLDRYERAAAVLASIWLIVLHVTVLLHAGGLWRDEVNTVNLAGAESFSALWSLNDHDSFPLLWFVVLRGWMAVGLAGSDLALRGLGLLVGLGLLASLWWTARAFGLAAPLFSLLLFGLNPAVLRFGDSLRAYGLGMLLLLLMLGCIWKVVERTDRKRVGLACTISVLAVQTLYFSSIILFAACLAGFAVSLRNRVWKTAGVLMVIGLLSACSLLPYLNTLVRQSWHDIIKVNVTVPWLAYKFQEAIASSGAFVVWVWAALFAVSIHFCCRRILASKHDIPDRGKSKVLFFGVLMVVGLLCFMTFLLALSYPTEPWYYLPLMGLLSQSIDVITFLIVNSNQAWRIVRLGFFGGMLLLTAPNAWQAAHIRQTNIDLVAAKLQSLCARNDLIIVNSWHLGISFSRYQRGLPWQTLPRMSEHRIVQYEVMKERMAEPDPIRADLAAIAAVLRSGARVWWVGLLPRLEPGESTGYLPPAPQAALGWQEGPYVEYWSRQAAKLFQEHAASVLKVDLITANPVSSYENAEIHVVTGWR